LGAVGYKWIKEKGFASLGPVFSTES